MMNKLLKKGLTIIGFLMFAVISFTGCAWVEEHATIQFSLGLETHTLLSGWQAVGAGVLLFAVIAAIIIVVQNKKKK